MLRISNNMIEDPGTKQKLSDKLASVDSLIGNVTTLTTNAKTSVVAAINENVSSLAENVQHIGIEIGTYANGDGTDETTKIQNALNANAGKNFVFPYGKSFKVNGLMIPDNTVIIGYGSKLYNGSSGSVISNVGNGVKIYGLEIQGQGNATYQDADRGIQITGGYSGSTITYQSDIVFEDCYIHDIGGYGFNILYGNNIKIRGCRIQNIGYVGVFTLSSKKVYVQNHTWIENISPGILAGSNYQCYGVTFTRTSTSSDLTQFPRSTDCTVENCTIEDIPTWEALDTHAGENILFKNNTIRNCMYGVAITDNAVSGTSTYAPNYCSAVNNTIYGISGGKGYGISVTGATGTIGSSVESAKGCKVEGNRLINCGTDGSSAYLGALYVRDTMFLSVVNNTFIDCYTNALCFYHDNYGFVVEGNTVGDVQSASYAVPAAFYVDNQYNSGVISGLTAYSKNASLNTYVSKRAIEFNTITNNSSITVGSLQTNYPTKYVNVTGMQMMQPKSQSSSSPSTATGASISTAYVSVARVSPSAAVTGVILQAGLFDGQEITVQNESANLITFGDTGSNVSGGSAITITGGRAQSFRWNSNKSLWFAG